MNNKSSISGYLQEQERCAELMQFVLYLYLYLEF